MGRSFWRRRQREQDYGAKKFERSETSEIDVGQLEDALSTMKPKLREIVVAKIWGGLTFEEIGQLTHTSSTKAHRDFHKGLNQLREIMGLNWLVEK